MKIFRKKDFINIFICFISILLVLGVAEIIMRVAWKMGGWVQRPIYRRSQNPYLRYEFVPSAKSGRISINSDGFRGREVSVKKPKDTFRIIMLGDSETFSYMLDEDKTLPCQLEKILNQNSSILNYEVLNFGVEGYSTFQELEMLKTKGLKYEPDLIILNYVFNDPEPGEYYFDKSFFMRHSALVRYFTFRIKKSLIRAERKRIGLKNEIDNYYYYHQPKYFNRVKEAIWEISDISKGFNQKLVVVIFPTSSIMVKDFRQNYPYRELHRIIKTIRTGNNIVLIDLLDEFNRLGLSPQDVSINYKYDESHKNAMALNVGANYIYENLLENKIIPH